ncbi:MULTISPECIES: hypothetical protein [Paenibacillus]|uniref:hypothetical protein n=1 Tax=Paenibacillus TaxID=44249 RepID=UPI0022B909D0|nr:hypothetical protein [Paenibacillus caseinilyticus]MCZ8519639.1 hypothetical protein [Paenibacillus caseinilyticus]
MLKKIARLAGIALMGSALFISSASAMPASSDPFEPVNNSYTTTYQFSQNTWTSYIQYSNDFDYMNFVSPKTGSQEVWLIPPYGKNYAIGIYEYGSGTPVAYKQSYGNYTTMTANLVAGHKYSVLVFPVDGSYDTEASYIFGFPLLFPF